MENKIIRNFTLEELNLILGGIKERNVYSFSLFINNMTEIDESRELFKGDFKSYLNAYSIIYDLFIKLARSLKITKKDESILLINYFKIAEEVRRYFKNMEIDIDNIYENHENIHTFMDYLNDNPVIKELENKIENIVQKKGSIIVFNIYKGFSFDELILVETPKDYTENHIMVNTYNIAFDNLITKVDNSNYSYPFTALKGKNFKSIFYDKLILLKTLSFDIELADDDNPEFRKNGITHYYSFSKKANIFNGNLSNSVRWYNGSNTGKY